MAYPKADMSGLPRPSTLLNEGDQPPPYSPPLSTTVFGHSARNFDAPTDSYVSLAKGQSPGKREPVSQASAALLRLTLGNKQVQERQVGLAPVNFSESVNTLKTLKSYHELLQTVGAELPSDFPMAELHHYLGNEKGSLMKAARFFELTRSGNMQESLKKITQELQLTGSDEESLIRLQQLVGALQQVAGKGGFSEVTRAIQQQLGDRSLTGLQQKVSITCPDRTSTVQTCESYCQSLLPAFCADQTLLNTHFVNTTELVLAVLGGALDMDGEHFSAADAKSCQHYMSLVEQLYKNTTRLTIDQLLLAAEQTSFPKEIVMYALLVTEYLQMAANPDLKQAGYRAEVQVLQGLRRFLTTQWHDASETKNAVLREQMQEAAAYLSLTLMKCNCLEQQATAVQSVKKAVSQPAVLDLDTQLTSHNMASVMDIVTRVSPSNAEKLFIRLEADREWEINEHDNPRNCRAVIQKTFKDCVKKGGLTLRTICEKLRKVGEGALADELQEMYGRGVLEKRGLGLTDNPTLPQFSNILAQDVDFQKNFEAFFMAALPCNPAARIFEAKYDSHGQLQGTLSKLFYDWNRQGRSVTTWQEIISKLRKVDRLRDLADRLAPNA